MSKLIKSGEKFIYLHFRKVAEGRKSIYIMILSMTGFGRGVCASQQKKITVEIKSLNSKQLDLFMRSPALYRQAETEVRTELTALLERGKVEYTAQAENIGSHAACCLNTDLLEIYKRQISEAGSRLGIGDPQDWYNVLLRMPEAIGTPSDELDPDDREAYMNASREAAEALVNFRIMEGAKLYDFFALKIEAIRRLLAKVEPFEKQRVEKIRLRLEEQLGQNKGVEYDRGRLEQELIFYIEKLDVSEEKLRLRSHLDYFMETMGERDGRFSGGGHGKKLGFIAQEMGREINTLGSKSNDADMQRLVVMMKDELEQIKEQVLNVL